MDFDELDRKMRVFEINDDQCVLPSMLFHFAEDAFQRKLRKLISILAGEASARFSLLLGNLGAFDCRISQLPTREWVVDYFRWRMEDASRNALNSHCYWLLRQQGQSVSQATKALEGLSVANKNELLFVNGINFNELPNWQKRGVGVYWEAYTKTGHNPITQEDVTTTRRQLITQPELPMKDDYARLIATLLDNMGQ